MLGLDTAVAQNGPSFEVVSVRAIPEKEIPPVGFSATPQISNGRLTWITTASYIVTYAHDLPAWRISGMKREVSFYRISAALNPEASVDEVRGMLRGMLRERFGFAAHSESGEVSGYNLVVGKNGHKLTAAGSEIPPQPAYFSIKPPEVFEGRVITSMEGRGITANTGRRVPVQKLADELSNVLSTFVDDRTGLPGDYYWGFTFQQPDYLPSGALELAPSVFDAIRDSLGLTLEKAKRPVEFLVVDHLEKLPTDN